jgi:hypothetical protein
VNSTLPSLPPPNTAPFTLEEIALATGGTLARGHSATQVLGAVTDTRMIAPTLEASTCSDPSTCGPLFIALRGANFDGHELAAQAVEAGASALLVERELDLNVPQVLVADTLQALGDLANFHRRRFSSLLVVAVTGSYGKTTTRAMIEAALSAPCHVLASEGNFNNEIGLPLTLLRLDESHQAAVVEMGMRGPGQIEYLAKMAAPDIGVVTMSPATHRDAGLADGSHTPRRVAFSLRHSGVWSSRARRWACDAQVLAGEPARCFSGRGADRKYLQHSPVDGTDASAPARFLVGDDRLTAALLASTTRTTPPRSGRRGRTA